MTLPFNQSQIAHTTAEWTSLNPILTLNTIGIEVMTNGYNRYKRGDGVTAWLSLPYIDKVYKQDILIDDIPTDGSSNPVASNGVYDALVGKQDKISNTANRLFYGSGTSGALNQLTSPSTSGSFLRQNASGAPYFSVPSSVLSDIGAQRNLDASLNSVNITPCPSGQWVDLVQKTLNAGLYLIFCAVLFQNNNTGIRRLSLGQSAAYQPWEEASINAVSGVDTMVTYWRIVGLDATTTMHLLGYQNSGSTINANTARLVPLRLG